jgi:hypothetical protein
MQERYNSQNKMTTTIRVKGWITDCNLIEPKKDFFSNDKSLLSIYPEDTSVYASIEQKTRALKEENESPYDKVVSYKHKDKTIEGCNVVFETIRTPQIEGDLRELDHDSQFIGRFVNVVGNLQILPNGNVYLSPHIIEPLVELTGVDVYDEEGDWDF